MSVSGQTRRLRKQGWYGAKRYVKTALSQPVLHPLLRAVAPRVPGITVRRLPAPAHLREVSGHVDIREPGADPSSTRRAEFVMLRPDRCEIAKEMYWGDGERPDPRDTFALRLITQLSCEARVLLDVGAYTGVFSLAAAAANPHLQVRAFDIVPPVVRMLEANVVRNGMRDRVQVRGTGVGDPSVTLHMPSTDRGPSLPSFYSPEMDFKNGVDVPLVSLDSLTDEVADRVAEAGSGSAGPAGNPAAGAVVMKIDVEGGEPDVFRHGAAFLEAFRPDILCEILPGADAVLVEEQLRPFGLRFYAVGDSWLEARETITPEPAIRDWFFSMKSPADLRSLGIDVR